MRVAVTSTVIFDVPSDRSVAEIQRRFLEAHEAVIGQPLETLTGQVYVLRRVERLEVVRLRDEPGDPSSGGPTHGTVWST